ncbi:KH domain-containing protein [Candidatus Microgenomates bacterium]|nr:KH domain-containing protein [Candidatus Microgenomates bacterium]
MEDLIKFLAKEVTGFENPEVTSEDRDGITYYIISVPQEHVGKLIGKQGRIISALRTIVSVRASKEGIRIGIEVKEV